MNYQSLKLLIASCLIGVAAQAHLEPQKVSSLDKLSNGRIVFDKKAKLPVGAAAKALASMKRARLSGDYKGCATDAAAARKAAPILAPWISVQELECANLFFTDKKDNSRLLPAIQAAEINVKVLGPHESRLQNRILESRLTLLESDIKSNRNRAAENIEKLEATASSLDEKQKSKLWRLAGELAFLQQRIDESREYFNRSLNLVDSDDVRGRLAAIDSTLLGKTNFADLAKPAATPTPASDLEASDEENELVTRVTASLKSGDLVPAVEDSLKIITSYPGSARAKWATDRVQEVYLQLGEKTEAEFARLKEKVIREMLRADADRNAEWARVAYNKGFYSDSLRLAQRALKDLSDSARSTKTYALAAEAALHTDNLGTAKDLYQTLVSKHSGTAESREAILRIGLLEYRAKNYQNAISSFERLLALPKIDNLEVTARHWLWRSFQKLNDQVRAKAAADALIEKYPFSYYGLRARIELAGGTLEWTKEKAPNIQSKLWLTKTERAAYNRAKTLIEGGWYDEAQIELNQLPKPVKPEEKALRSQLLAAAFNYPEAVRLINEAWDKNSDFRKEPFLSVGFPREFQETIGNEANTRKVEPDLVLSLMKQESSFNIRAQSSSNAYGLMQIIGPTAKEISTDLRLGNIMIPEDMWVPDQNIKMGTYYLSKVIKKWNGNVPLGLASYNAGPHRLERWINSRPSLKDIALSRSSNPDDELWFDELPWDETSFYVKAILRNLLLYRTLAKGKIQISDPIWQ
jgi:soluble lytic murein transglycosylase